MYYQIFLIFRVHQVLSGLVSGGSLYHRQLRWPVQSSSSPFPSNPRATSATSAQGTAPLLCDPTMPSSKAQTSRSHPPTQQTKPFQPTHCSMGMVSSSNRRVGLHFYIFFFFSISGGRDPSRARSGNPYLTSEAGLPIPDGDTRTHQKVETSLLHLFISLF